MTASSCALVNDSLLDTYCTHPLNNLYNPIALRLIAACNTSNSRAVVKKCAIYASASTAWSQTRGNIRLRKASDIAEQDSSKFAAQISAKEL